MKGLKQSPEQNLTLVSIYLVSANKNVLIGLLSDQ